MIITPAYAKPLPVEMRFELLFPLIMVFAIIYFMILRPQKTPART